MAKDVFAVDHADRRRDVVMPYAPALLVRRGSLVFLSGVTAAPVSTLEAAGCSLRDVVSATRYLTDVHDQDDLNRVWAADLGDHLPTTATVEVSRLATHARCKLEISAIAVADT